MNEQNSIFNLERSKKIAESERVLLSVEIGPDAVELYEKLEALIDEKIIELSVRQLNRPWENYG